MSTLAWIILANFIISVFSLVGVFTLAINEKILQKILLSLVSLSAGALLGGAFLDLLPEASEQFGDSNYLTIVLISFLIFFLIEKILHWRHCHKGHCEVHTFGYLNLVGDGIHNFIDGVIIATTFSVDIRLGIVTSVALALHEIPQEIGDFGVLIYAGFEKKKALIANFLIACTAILGGIFGYFLTAQVENSVKYLLPFAAGGFIYIAGSDLIPEIRKETSLVKSLSSFVMFIIGILIIYSATFFE